MGADQVAHVEITREIARRFNHIYGREPDFEELAESACDKMGKKGAKLYRSLRKTYLENGDQEALQRAQALVKDQQNITLADRERLIGYLEGTGKVILPEPQALLTEAAKMPGLDGQKMSKSYGNTIGLREEPDSVSAKMKRMPTDPARVRLSDPELLKNVQSGSFMRRIQMIKLKIGCDKDVHLLGLVVWSASNQ